MYICTDFCYYLGLFLFFSYLCPINNFSAQLKQSNIYILIIKTCLIVLVNNNNPKEPRSILYKLMPRLDSDSSLTSSVWEERSLSAPSGTPVPSYSAAQTLPLILWSLDTGLEAANKHRFIHQMSPLLPN